MTDTTEPSDLAWQQAMKRLEAPELGLLGTVVRDLYLRVGPEALSDPGVALLVTEAVDEVISHLSSSKQMQQSLERDGWYQRHGSEPPGPLPITLEDVAQTSIDHAFGDGLSADPPLGEQVARIRFALTLDPACSDAYLIRGAVEEAAGQWERARVAYERAMHLAAKQLGEDAFSEAARREGRVHFWGAIETRGYMRARAALGMVLWQQGKLAEAVEHFAGLIALNPNDNQGMRDFLLCGLLELGDDQRLGRALKDHRYYRFDTGKEENREPCWWYTYAAWLFRTQSALAGNRPKEDATEVLRNAFLLNRYVPIFLLDPKGLPGLDELSSYAQGSPTEAALYVNLAVKGWQQTSGALAWLETMAREQGLLPGADGTSPFAKITIQVRPPRESAPSWWPDPHPPERPTGHRRPRPKAHPPRRT